MTPAPAGAHPSPEEVDALLDLDDPTEGAPTGPSGPSARAVDPDDAPVSVEVAEHVRGCEQCRELLAGMRSVRELLRTAAREDLEPPADLDARLGAALARASAERTGTIVPLAAASAARERPGRPGPDADDSRARVPRWLTLAAGLAVLAGAGAAATQLLDGDGSEGQASMSQADAGAPRAAAAPVTSSGTGYTEDALAAQVTTLLDAPADSALDGTESGGGDLGTLSSPSAPDGSQGTQDGQGNQDGAPGADEEGLPGSGTDEPGVLSVPGDAAAPRLQEPEVLSRCLDALGATDPPLRVDQGTWDGEPAAVVVLPGSTPDTVQVWVVGAACGVDGDDLRHFQVVTR
ncbi:anti-sigma factor family protein [Thalassiella azotivora]